ncbi:hypothetical protein HAX54_053458, partial [Datura stramonium]|nr:hypothetical protein [Datura stramonium]
TSDSLPGRHSQGNGSQSCQNKNSRTPVSQCQSSVGQPSYQKVTFSTCRKVHSEPTPARSHQTLSGRGAGRGAGSTIQGGGHPRLYAALDRRSAKTSSAVVI